MMDSVRDCASRARGRTKDGFGASITLAPNDFSTRVVYAGPISERGSYVWVRIQADLVAPGPAGSVIIEYEHGVDGATIAYPIIMGPLTGPGLAGGGQLTTQTHPARMVAIRARWNNASSQPARITVNGGSIGGYLP